MLIVIGWPLYLVGVLIYALVLITFQAIYWLFVGIAFVVVLVFGGLHETLRRDRGETGIGAPL